MGVLVLYGHEPEAVRTWPWADVVRALHAHYGHLEATATPFSDPSS